MKLERSKNTKRNIKTGAINKFITLLLPFILRTVMIRVMGAEYLGLNSLFSSILQVLNLAELGFGSAIVYSMYKPIAENDRVTVCALYALYKRLYRIVGFVVLVAGLVIVPFLTHLISGSVPSDVNIYVIYFIYLGNTVLTYFLFAYKSSLLNAMQRNDVISNVNTLTQGMMNLIQIFLIITIKDYYLYLIMMPIATVANNIIISVVVDKMYPDIKCYGSIPKELKKEIKKNVSGLLIGKICGTTRNSLDSICCSAFLGLTVTAMYNNYYYIINGLTVICGVVTTAMTAGVGNSIALDSKTKNYEDMRKLNFGYMMLSGWMSVCLLCLYQSFIKVWVGKDYLFNFIIVIAFTLYFYILKVGDIITLYSSGSGLWWEQRYRAIGESVSNIILNIILAKYFGVLGVILATIISLLVFNVIGGSYIIFKYYFKNKKLKEYLLEQLMYFTNTLIIALITLLSCKLVHLDYEILNLLVKMIICSIVPFILYIAIYKHTKHYKDSVPWILDKMNVKNTLIKKILS